MPGLANDLNISDSGYVSHNGSGIFLGRTFQAGTGITLTNADGISGNTTISSTASLTDLHTARFIVASSTAGTGANFTTIASAIASAQGTGLNSTIFLQPGTYTENFTLPPGINLCAYTVDSITPNVIISGNITMTAAGTCSISGIRLQTNSAALLTVSGNSATILNLKDCYINCTNNTGIIFSSSSSSSQVNLINCQGNIGTTGISLFSHSSSGTLSIRQSVFTNTGGSSTASTCSAGALNCMLVQFNFPITFSSTGSATCEYCTITTSSQNVACSTLGGGTTSWKWCRFDSGSASSLSITSSANECIDCYVSSSNTNAITGAGTLTYSPFSFGSTSSTINVTTQNISAFGSNVTGFLAVKNSQTNNVTGNGAVYTVICDTEVYDTLGNYNNSTGLFTAPVKGKYEFVFKVYVTGCTIATSCSVAVVTTARTYAKQDFRAAGAQDFGTMVVCIADMASGDTASFTVTCAGEAGDTDDVLGNNAPSGTTVQGRFLGTN